MQGASIFTNNNRTIKPDHVYNGVANAQIVSGIISFCSDMHDLTYSPS